MPPATCDLSILIVNWNTRDLLADCLRSIADFGLPKPAPGAQDMPIYQSTDLPTIEVIVVDNASTDGSAAMVKHRFPWAHVIENHENVGFARANNQAVAAAKGRYLLLLNSDCMLVPGAIDAMVTHFDQDPCAGIVSVCLAFPDGSPQFCYGTFPSVSSEFKSLFGMHRWDLSSWGRINTPLPVDWVSGACLMARRSMLDQIGLLDEASFMFGEEVDLCLRGRRAGWGIYLVPSSPVIHVRAGSTGKTVERILRLYRGKMYYARKHLGPVRSRLILAMIVASTASKLLTYSAVSLVLPEMVARRDLWLQIFRHLLRRGINGRV